MQHALAALINSSSTPSPSSMSTSTGSLLPPLPPLSTNPNLHRPATTAPSHPFAPVSPPVLSLPPLSFPAVLPITTASAATAAPAAVSDPLAFLGADERARREQLKRETVTRWGSKIADIPLFWSEIHGGCWVPAYEFQEVKTVLDVWAEYADGLRGKISVRELEENYGATWRRNIGSTKSEWTRRKKVVDAVKQAANRVGHSTVSALTELSIRFPKTCPLSKIYIQLREDAKHAKQPAAAQ